MKYFLVERQAGEGCDYTIGCGLRVTELSADSVEAATAAAVARIDGHPDDGSAWQRDDCGVARAELLVVQDVVDLAQLLNASAAQRKAKEERDSDDKREASERAELERLKAKFGG
jgi:hypothetical protein